MPSVRSLITRDTGDILDVIDAVSRKTIPDSFTTGKSVATVQGPADTWVVNNITGYQMRIHVFSTIPIRFGVICADLGVVIPDDWWDRLPIVVP